MSNAQRRITSNKIGRRLLVWVTSAILLATFVQVAFSIVRGKNYTLPMPSHVDFQFDGKSFCQGVLLDVRPGSGRSDIILTAAHCFGFEKKPSELTAVFGKSRSNDSNAKSSVLEEIIVHEQFNLSTHVNDIAIVRTKEVIVFDHPEQYQKILGARVQFGTDLEVGKRCDIFGWGRTSLTDGNAKPSVLQLLPVRTARYNDREYACGGISMKFQSQKMICLETIPPSNGFPYGGDSGTGLYCHDDQTVEATMVRGLLSHSSPNGGGPHAHTKLADHQDWLKKIKEITRVPPE